MRRYVARAGYERLAAALGADLQSVELKQARSELTTASAELRAAILAKPGILVIFTYANTEGLSVAGLRSAHQR